MSSSIERLINTLKEVILTQQEIRLSYGFFEDVKEMHKQEIIDAINEGIKQGYSDYRDTQLGKENDYNPEKYYEETFKKNTEIDFQENTDMNQFIVSGWHSFDKHKKVI